MRIDVVKYTPAESTAVSAFNQRMLGAEGATDFLLPDQPNEASSAMMAAPDAITWTKYLAVDDGGDVRGGFLLMEVPGWLNGENLRIANYQAPLSEGVHDKRFSLVGMHMLKYVQHQTPYCYVVGMGNAARPLPRLLKAAGWTVRETPFFFRVVNAGRVCRELKPLQTRPLARVLAAFAARSGMAHVGTAILHARRHVVRFTSRATTIEPVHDWGAWANDLWDAVRSTQSFGIARNMAALRQLYPLNDGRCAAFLIRQGGSPVGWAAYLNTQMRDHPWFGNLTVATILDCVAIPDAATATVSLTADRLAAAGADLIVTNQLHAQWTEACRACGFLSGPSNYLFATSKPLADAISRGGADRVHLNRGDGDGRIHL